MNFRAVHLPRFDAAPDVCVLERDGARALAPRLTAPEVDRICDALLAARSHLAHMPVQRIIAAIDAATRRLRAPDTPAHHALVHGIAAFTGYAPAMAAHVLARMSDDWLAAPLERLVRAELGGFDAVDDFILRHGVRSRAVASPLTLHLFAGNVPGVSVTSIVRALLVKSAVLGKSAAGEPLLAAHFAQLLSDVDVAVGDCVAITYWSGGDDVVETAALARVDTVIHYGSAAAIAAMRERAPVGVRFIEHGPRISFAIVNGATPLEGAAHDLARAVALFDQQGCVSPQTAYVIGDANDARSFAAHVASALGELQHELPRGRIDVAEAAAVRDIRTRAEFRAIRGEPVELWSGENLAWTVVLEPSPEFTGTCLNRTLLVKPVASAHRLLELVRPFGAVLQTVGVAGFSGETLLALARALGDAGATRITTIAQMPWPPPTWHHDGRGPLNELIRWVDLESG